MIINARGCPRVRMQSCEIVRPSSASADTDDFGPGSHTKVQVQLPIAEAVADASAELEALRHDTEGVDWHPVPLTHGEATTHPQVRVRERLIRAVIRHTVAYLLENAGTTRVPAWPGHMRLCVTMDSQPTQMGSAVCTQAFQH